MTKKAAGTVEHELSDIRYELTARSRRITELELLLDKRSMQVEALHHELAVREQRMRSMGEALDDAEELSACYQEQVLRAAKKIRTDTATASKAKKAMAVSLTVLNERPSLRAD